MSLRRAACCCEPATAVNCREFQIACFNTDKYANMPEYATIVGSAASVTTIHHYEGFPSPTTCRCPVKVRIRSLAAWSVTVRKLPQTLPGQFGQCAWLGLPNDRICWGGVGGTFKYEEYETGYELCDFRPNQQGGGCGCVLDPNDPCLTPNLLRYQRETKVTGQTRAFVTCSADSYLDSSNNCLSLFGHSVEARGEDCTISFYEKIFPPFCNGCPGPFGAQVCEYRSTSVGELFDGGAGFARGCGGDLDGSIRDCIIPGGTGFGIPRSVFFGTPVGGEKVLDSCGRTRKKATCECSLTFS